MGKKKKNSAEKAQTAADAKAAERKKTARRFRAGLIIILVFVILSAAACPVIFGLVFGRSEISDPYAMTRADIDAERYPCTACSFESGSNTLQGYYYTAEDPEGIIVVSSGMSSDGNGHLPEILYFVDNGWSVFAYDGTGAGASEGAGTKGLPQYQLDLRAALAWLTANTKGLPIMLYGHSAGAYAAAAVLDDYPIVSAAVCLAPFDTPDATMTAFSRRYVSILADIESPFMKAYSRLLFGADSDESAEETISDSQIPVLIIYGTGDEVIPEKLSVSRSTADYENPNVSVFAVTEEGRNTHSTLWLDEEALAYRESLPENGDYSAEELLAANELNETFMETILSFYEAAA